MRILIAAAMLLAAVPFPTAGPTVRVKGRVTAIEATNATHGIQGVSVLVFDSGKAEIGHGVTASDGTYSISVKGSPARVVFSRAQYQPRPDSEPCSYAPPAVEVEVDSELASESVDYAKTFASAIFNARLANDTKREQRLSRRIEQLPKKDRDAIGAVFAYQPGFKHIVG